MRGPNKGPYYAVHQENFEKYPTMCTCEGKVGQMVTTASIPKILHDPVYKAHASYLEWGCAAIALKLVLI